MPQHRQPCFIVLMAHYGEQATCGSRVCYFCCYATQRTIAATTSFEYASCTKMAIRSGLGVHRDNRHVSSADIRYVARRCPVLHFMSFLQSTLLHVYMYAPFLSRQSTIHEKPVPVLSNKMYRLASLIRSQHLFQGRIPRHVLLVSRSTLSQPFRMPTPEKKIREVDVIRISDPHWVSYSTIQHHPLANKVRAAYTELAIIVLAAVLRPQNIQDVATPRPQSRHPPSVQPSMHPPRLALGTNKKRTQTRS